MQKTLNSCYNKYRDKLNNNNDNENNKTKPFPF